ncbi:999ec40d-37e3-43cd-a734-d6b6265fd184 [Thermothielavioides terrestris]|nr:999ec40d-37e3-43cd-a734-d6b6265fd184 [Thermothielavioides terrestris]
MTKPITLLHALTATLFPLTQAKACTEGLNYRGYNLLKKGT